MRGETRRGVWRNPVHLVATGLGAGMIPVAPGTLGTLLAVPLYLLIAPLAPLMYLGTVALLFVAGVWLCGRTARDFHAHDPAFVVWDEIVGFLVALTAAPPGWLWVAAGFILFRLFDIWKPFPIRWVERHVPEGLGIMLDDLLAGVYAFGGIQVLAYLAE